MVVTNDLTEDVAFKLRSEGQEGTSPVTTAGRTLQAEGTQQEGGHELEKSEGQKES